MGASEMGFQQIIAMLQASLIPVVMISGLGLLCLVIQNRYGRIVDRIRALCRERREILHGLAGGPEDYTSLRQGEVDVYRDRLGTIGAQVKILARRGLIVKWSLFATFSAIFCFILTSLLIWVESTVILAVSVTTAIMGAFYCGMILTFLGVALLIRDIAMTYKAILIEIEAEK